jgi:hypothetical protein
MDSLAGHVALFDMCNTFGDCHIRWPYSLVFIDSPHTVVHSTAFRSLALAAFRMVTDIPHVTHAPVHDDLSGIHHIRWHIIALSVCALLADSFDIVIVIVFVSGSVTVSKTTHAPID